MKTVRTFYDTAVEFPLSKIACFCRPRSAYADGGILSWKKGAVNLQFGETYGAAQGKTAVIIVLTDPLSEACPRSITSSAVPQFISSAVLTEDLLPGSEAKLP